MESNSYSNAYSRHFGVVVYAVEMKPIVNCKWTKSLKYGESVKQQQQRKKTEKNSKVIINKCAPRTFIYTMKFTWLKWQNQANRIRHISDSNNNNNIKKYDNNDDSDNGHMKWTFYGRYTWARIISNYLLMTFAVRIRANISKHLNGWNDCENPHINNRMDDNDCYAIKSHRMLIRAAERRQTNKHIQKLSAVDMRDSIQMATVLLNLHTSLSLSLIFSFFQNISNQIYQHYSPKQSEFSGTQNF